MKRRKRTSDDSGLPVVTKRPDGKFSVEVAEGCFITWWMERENGEEHHFVQLRAPDKVPIRKVDNGAELIMPTKH